MTATGLEPTGNNKVKVNVKQQIQSGKYNLGFTILLQTFKRISVKDKKIVTEDIATKGRKVLFKKDVKGLSKLHDDFFRLTLYG